MILWRLLDCSANPCCWMACLQIDSAASYLLYGIVRPMSLSSDHSDIALGPNQVTHATSQYVAKDAAASGILGLAIGDALGVPVEFWSRQSLEDKPVNGMHGHGTHNQPAGTWSDDTS